jgi:hypothetical protein
LANERDGLSLSITEQGVIDKILRHIAFKHADTPHRPARYLNMESNAYETWGQERTPARSGAQSQ